MKFLIKNFIPYVSKDSLRFDDEINWNDLDFTKFEKCKKLAVDRKYIGSLCLLAYQNNQIVGIIIYTGFKDLCIIEHKDVHKDYDFFSTTEEMKNHLNKKYKRVANSQLSQID